MSFFPSKRRLDFQTAQPPCSSAERQFSKRRRKAPAPGRRLFTRRDFFQSLFDPAEKVTIAGGAEHDLAAQLAADFLGDGMDEIRHRRPTLTAPSYPNLARRRRPPAFVATWLNRQPHANLGFNHVLAFAGQHHRAAVHHDVIVGQIARPFKILLDKEDRKIAALTQIEDGPADVADD